MLPNFLIIGAAKAGTTSLYHYVRQHPQAFMPEKKELSFFCEEFHWNRGLRWYEAQFEKGASADAVGEASPRYSVYPMYSGVPARIADLLPLVRLIYLIREPIARMQSHYLDRVVHGKEKRSVEEALLKDPFYVTSSRYGLQIEQYLQHFSREQLLIVQSDDLQSNRDSVLPEIYRFLGIDPAWRGDVMSEEFLVMRDRVAPRGMFRRLWYSPVSTRVGRVLPKSVRERFRSITGTPVNPSRGDISQQLRRQLEDLLREDVTRLRHYVDASFDGWGLG